MTSLEILLGDKASSEATGLMVLLKNRCAYSIGRNQAERNWILTKFDEIYDVRSRIVHRGHRRLTKAERMLFFLLQDLVRRTICHEIKVQVG